jgi:hypothetical protein
MRLLGLFPAARQCLTHPDVRQFIAAVRKRTGAIKIRLRLSLL